MNFHNLNISDLSPTYQIFNRHYFPYNPETGHLICSDRHRYTKYTELRHLDTCCDNWQNALDYESRSFVTTSTKTLDIMLVEYMYDNTRIDHVKQKPNGTWPKAAQGLNIGM